MEKARSHGTAEKRLLFSVLSDIAGAFKRLQVDVSKT
jgi:hypothetical protein